MAKRKNSSRSGKSVISKKSGRKGAGRKASPKNSPKSKNPSKSKSSPKAPPARQERGIGQIAAAIIAGAFVLVLIGLAAYYLSEPAAPAATENEILVLVNDVPIMRSEFEFQYNLLPESYRSQLSREDVLEQVIAEELVVQAARAEGMEATPQDVNEQVQGILAQNGLSIVELQINLEHSNVTMDEFENLIERQILIDRYTAAHIEVEDPADDVLKDLYDLSQERYAVPEEVTVRHVLVAIQREDAAGIAKDVYDRARSGEEFCLLVTENSDDKGSLENCGEYSFAKGVMVPQFEQAAFGMEVGEFRLVQSPFGYHIIEKIAHEDAGITPFEEVRSEVLATYRSAEYLKKYKELTSDLRADAVIAYPGDPSQESVPEESLDAAPGELPATDDATAGDAPNEGDAASNDAGTIQDTGGEEQSLAQCIAGRAALYGASWSSDTREAGQLLAGADFEYVLCDADAQACEDAGIAAYPTWVIDGEKHLGKLSVERLAVLTGCS